MLTDAYRGKNVLHKTKDEMQIRTTGKYHFTLVSVAITEKSTDNK